MRLVRHFLSTWLPPLVWMAVIFAFSSQHGGGHLPAAEVVLRKLAHVAEYFVLTLLLLRALRRRTSRRPCPSRSSRRSPTRSATSGTSPSCPGAPQLRATSRSTASASRSRRRRHAHPPARAHRMSDAVVFSERAIAPGGDAIWPAALEHLARRFASIRELDVAAVPARESAVAALEAWAGDDVSSWRLELGRFYDDHARMHLRRDPGPPPCSPRCAPTACGSPPTARARARPRRSRSRSWGSTDGSTRSCSSPPETATRPAWRRSAWARRATSARARSSRATKLHLKRARRPRSLTRNLDGPSSQ